MTDDAPAETLAETGKYAVWVSEEPDGETVWHLELGGVTLHFFREEWEELRRLMQQASRGHAR
ncbi:MAG: hypothetical protein OXP68_12015 [Anaerolineaceae bacterium]|nr:hypothetical protein [Anaerolineaceae bacterium]MDE0329154.1 hypothetical protein [Anaerolineaceae bacterium]